MKRYVLHPGFVTSKTDGDRHFINPTKLARLYNVDIKKCIVLHREDRGYRHQEGDIHLYPRYQGDYDVIAAELREGEG